MPPRLPIVQAPSVSPPPTSAGLSDAQDILIIQDIMDTLDQIPPELTRVHSDLNELGAVLYTTLLNLEAKMAQLIEWVQDSHIGNEKRFQLLQEIAEDAARYKLGADDKIRVAGGACDGIMSHQRHISNLLNASNLLDSAPPSPYTTALTLSNMPALPTTRRGQLARAANSPFPNRGPGGAGGEGRAGETPTKKKKSRVQQLGREREEDEMSSVAGKDRRAPAKKRRPANRAVSPADSLGSTSAFAASKPVEPRTARQIAAAASKARKALDADEDSDDSGRDEPRRPGGSGATGGAGTGAGGVGMQVTPSTDSMMDRTGLGLEFGAGGHSRENTLGRSANATPVLANKAVMPKGNGGRGKRKADDEDGESDGDDGDDIGAAGARGAVGAGRKGNGGGGGAGNGNANNHANGRKGGGGAGGVGGAGPGGGVGAGEAGYEVDGDTAGEGETDGQLYCTCKSFSYGEMIGCDDDTCDIEWYHISCLGFDKAPEGNWVCDRCLERRKRNPKARKPAKPRRTK